jgi:hypothetical protein
MTGGDCRAKRSRRWIACFVAIPIFSYADGAAQGVQTLHSYPLDVDPEQLIRWIMAEREAKPLRFKLTANRGVETSDIPLRKEFRLGDEAREYVSDVATIATLEFAPAQNEGWSVTITVEDDIGPQPLDDASQEGAEEDLDLESFFEEFIRPGRGTATIVANAQTPAAKERLSFLLADVIRDRHDSNSGGPLQGRGAGR